MAARLIAVEGSDGAGKQTQTDMLYELLTGRDLKVARVSFPRYRDTVGGKLLFEVMKGDRADAYDFANLDPYAASMLYAMDRRESKPFLEQLREHNDVVIFDRYVESNLLHQGGKFKTDEERWDFSRWLFRLEYEVLGLRHPHDIVYLSIPFWLSRKRAELREQSGGARLDAVEKDMEYVKNGHDAGHFYANALGWHKVEGLVDGHELSPLQVHKEVADVLGYFGQEHANIAW